MFAPCCIETAIGGPQRSHTDTAGDQQRHPGAIRSQSRPTAPTQRQHDDIGAHEHLACRTVEAQRPSILRPSSPAMARMENHASGPKSAQPGAQQGCGLHLQREDATGTADECVDAEPSRPVAQLLRAESFKPLTDFLAASTVARNKLLRCFGVRQVESAAPCQKKLAGDRGHGIEHMDPTARGAQHFSCHQAGRTATDDDNAAGLRISLRQDRPAYWRGERNRLRRCPRHAPWA